MVGTELVGFWDLLAGGMGDRADFAAGAEAVVLVLDVVVSAFVVVLVDVSTFGCFARGGVGFNFSSH